MSFCRRFYSSVMDNHILKEKIERYYNNNMSEQSSKSTLSDLNAVINHLNDGTVRVLNTEDGSINEWVKKAILLTFKHTKISSQVFDSYDKIGLLQYDYFHKRYRKVPGAFIRNGVYIGNDCVIMPSYINIGAYIGDKTMIDINACVGSCAQIGKSCHISAGCVVGGVLEPIVASPVVIGDNCFLGANSAVLEGVIVEKRSVIASGLIISASTKIIDRETGNVMPFGVIPEGSVVVPGSYPSKNGLHINCAIIVKNVGKEPLEKLQVNEILREAID